ncbi:MAG: tetratricopeptide repeat protein [Cyanobacteria bacterium HKST-UBA04]|nr:tetratricopeptide repeat protein [Cyanobacteria bacterium HKST-UBA04]
MRRHSGALIAVACFGVVLTLSVGGCQATEQGLGGLMEEAALTLEAQAEAQTLDKAVADYEALDEPARSKWQQTDPWLGVIVKQRQALKADAGNARALAQACEGMVGRGHYFLAHRTCRQAIGMRPTLPLAHAMLGATYMMMAADDQAAASFRKALSLNPKQAGVYFYVGWFYDQVARQPDKARGYYRQAMAAVDSRHYPDAWYYTAKIQQKRRQFTQALATVEAGLTRHRYFSDFHELQGSIYRDLSLTTKQDRYFFKALGAYRQAIALNPDKAYYHNDLGYLYWVHGQSKASQKHYAKALALDGQLTSALTNMGVLCREQGHHDQAIGYFKKAVAVDPNDPENVYGLAEAYYYAGRYRQAEVQLQAYLAQRGEDAEAWYGLGMAYQNQQQWDKATEAFAKAVELKPTHQNAQAALTAAQLHKSNPSV